MQEAKINEEYTFPNGKRRVVQTIDIINAAHEAQRLLRIGSKPCGLSFKDLSISATTSASNKIETTGTALAEFVTAIPRLFGAKVRAVTL
jgi:hypothetical protein